MSLSSRRRSIASTASAIASEVARRTANIVASEAGSYAGSSLRSAVKRTLDSMSTSSSRNTRRRVSRATNSPFGRSVRFKRTKRTRLRKKGQKKVKVSKGLRAKIEKVCMDSDEVPAKYIKKYTGWVALSGNNTQDVPTDIQQTGLPVAGSTFTYFNPTKILDAASILFNGKFPVADWTGTINNLDDNKLVAHVDYMSVTWVLKNFGLIDLNIKIYECVAKKNNTSAQYAWDTWADNLLNDAGTVNLSSVNRFTPGITPSDASGFSSYWATKVRRITLRPGQVKKIKIFGPKGKFNFPDYFDNGTFQDVQKGITTNILMVIERPLGLWDDGADGGQIRVSLAGQATGNGNVLGMYVTEKFVIRAPEISNDSQKFKKFAYYSNFSAGTNLLNVSEPMFGRRAINNDTV